MSDKKILDLLDKLAAMYPRHVLNEIAVRTYVELLKKVEIELLSRTVDRWVKSERWFPTVVELIEMSETLEADEGSEKRYDSRLGFLTIRREVMDARQAAYRGDPDYEQLNSLSIRLRKQRLNQNADALDRFTLKTRALDRSK